MLALLAPGQGSQRSGFLRPWLGIDRFARHLAAASRVVGVDLAAAGAELSDADIRDTAITQPLIVAAGLATAALLGEPGEATVVAGHSVGEFTAVALSGAVDFDDALRLVAVRGRAMAAAAADPCGGMVAVLGGDPAEVSAAVDAAGCVTANHNAPDQIVAAGPAVALQRLRDCPPPGARVRPLAVAGAFHTDLMAPAMGALTGAVSSVRPRPARLGWVSNADGAVVDDGAEMLRRLVAQVCLPVRWDRCVETVTALGVTAAVELAPGGTLAGLVRRALPGLPVVAVRTPDDLAEARRLMVEHGTPLSDPPIPWQVAVSPARGVVRVPSPAVGAAIPAGAVLLEVTTRTATLPVTARCDGRLLEWLVQDGDPVTDGQPLARLAGA